MLIGFKHVFIRDICFGFGGMLVKVNNFLNQSLNMIYFLCSYALSCIYHEDFRSVCVNLQTDTMLYFGKYQVVVINASTNRS